MSASRLVRKESRILILCMIFQALAIVFSSKNVWAEDILRAIQTGDEARLVALLKNGENPNVLLKNGLPALLFAWESDERNIAEALLEMGANPHFPIPIDLQFEFANELVSIDKSTPLIFVFIKYSRLRPGFFELALRYLRKPSLVDSHGMTILHQHAEANLPFGCDPMIPLMLNSGVDPNALDKDGCTPVRRFAKRIAVVREILDPSVLLESGIHDFARAGADLFRTAPNGSTLFDDLASIANRPRFDGDQTNYVWSHVRSDQLKKFLRGKKHPCNELLLSEFEDCHISLSSLFTDAAAQEVCYWVENYPDVFEGMLTLEKYLEKGGDINHEGQAGLTFLWAAFQAGNTQAFEQLLDSGANIDHRLSGNIVEFYEDTSRGKSNIIYNGFFGARGETVLLAACSYPFRRKAFIGPSLRKTTELDQADELGRNALHRLLYHPLLDGQEDCLIDLIRAGVPLNAQTISGATPCHVAVPLNPAVIPALVYAGADPEIRNMHGQSVIDLLNLAIQEGWPRQTEYQEVLEWLHDRNK